MASIAEGENRTPEHAPSSLLARDDVVLNHVEADLFMLGALAAGFGVMITKW